MFSVLPGWNEWPRWPSLLSIVNILLIDVQILWRKKPWSQVSTIIASDVTFYIWNHYFEDLISLSESLVRL